MQKKKKMEPQSNGSTSILTLKNLRCHSPDAGHLPIVRSGKDVVKYLPSPLLRT